MKEKEEIFMKTYVAVYHNCATRDTQICKLNQDNLEQPWEDEYWEDVEDAEVFIGIFTAETEGEAMMQVIEQEGCDEYAVRLIEVKPAA